MMDLGYLDFAFIVVLRKQQKPALLSLRENIEPFEVTANLAQYG